MAMITRTLIVLSLVFVIVLIFWQGVLSPAESPEYPRGASPNSKETVIFEVEKGQGMFEIAKNLEKQKLVSHRFFFDLAVILERGVNRLQAGEYELSRSLSPMGIAGKIINGETAKETITVPEGWSLAEINAYLENKGVFGKEEFLAATDKDFSEEFSFLKDKPENASLEGYLFPDTYEIQRGEDAEILIKKMLANFDQKLTPELRTEIKRQEKTIFEIVTMASLLEKEVKTLEDKKMVAGILWKRLRTGMRLQVDATVLYALGMNPGQISYEDTKIDSPYNTYRYAGLPLGPISNPGLKSLKAAIYPQKNDNWYYLSAPEGETLFSRTLEEHNVKKVKYLR